MVLPAERKCQHMGCLGARCMRSPYTEEMADTICSHCTCMHILLVTTWQNNCKPTKKLGALEFHHRIHYRCRV